MSLFGAAAASRTKSLVEFKAGKMTLKGKMVHPDKRKGLVYVYQSDDSLMHFCWKDRSTGIVEDDLILFPDDIETRRITQCTTGRVFLMKFKSSSKKFFFWMQENDAEKDEKLWRKVNDLFNNPPMPGSSGSSSAASALNALGGGHGSNAAAAATAGLAGSLGGDFSGADLQNLLGNMSEQQLQAFLGNLMPVNSPSSNRSGSSSSISSNQTSRVQSTVGGSRVESTMDNSSADPGKAGSTQLDRNSTMNTPLVGQTKETSEGGDAKGAGGAGKKIQLSDLQSILGNLNPESRGDLDLSEVINLETMAPILADKQIQERLMQYLPESEILPKTEQEIRTTLTTPQFKKAMRSFSSALQRGQLGPLLKQFNLPEQVTLAAAQGNLVEFAKAMEEYSKSKQAEGQDDKMDTK